MGRKKKRPRKKARKKRKQKVLKKECRNCGLIVSYKKKEEPKEITCPSCGATVISPKNDTKSGRIKELEEEVKRLKAEKKKTPEIPIDVKSGGGKDETRKEIMLEKKQKELEKSEILAKLLAFLILISILGILFFLFDEYGLLQDFIEFESPLRPMNLCCAAGFIIFFIILLIIGIINGARMRRLERDVQPVTEVKQTTRPTETTPVTTAKPSAGANAIVWIVFVIILIIIFYFTGFFEMLGEMLIPTDNGTANGITVDEEEWYLYAPEAAWQSGSAPYESGPYTSYNQCQSVNNDYYYGNGDCVQTK